MYKIINKSCVFVEFFDNKIYSDPFINDYYKILLREVRPSSALKYIRCIHKYWLFNIYFPKLDNEDFQGYLYRYRDEYLTKGFELKTTGDYIRDLKPLIIKKYEPVKDPETDMIALENYYSFLLNSKLNTKFELFDNKDINLYTGCLSFKKQDLMNKHSKGRGYGLEAKGLMREAFAEKVTIFSKLKKQRTDQMYTIKQNGDTFPHNAFELLLDKTTNIRNKLLFLLCGSTSLRIGQALSLTTFDIDPINKLVYSINPNSLRYAVEPSGKPLFNQKPRKILLDNFGINFYRDYPDIGYKYNIPSDNRVTPLHFLRPKYRDLFFDLYSQWQKKIDKSFPMVFQTHGPGGTSLLDRSNATKYLTESMKKVDKEYPQFSLMNLENKFHSLRHMFGTVMANTAYLHQYLRRNKIIETPDGDYKDYILLFKDFTRRKMGHKNISSTDRYFTTDRHIDEFILNQIATNENEINSILESFDQVVEASIQIRN